MKLNHLLMLSTICFNLSCGLIKKPAKNEAVSFSNSSGSVSIDQEGAVSEETAVLPMMVNRSTITHLKNGRILIAGGVDISTETSVNLAQLFDPSTMTFSEPIQMNQARSEHTATLLPDGRVLIAGGGGENNEGTAEIYDADTNVFIPVGEMIAPRRKHAAILSNEKVIAIGGEVFGGIADAANDPNFHGIETIEIFDPLTNSWNLANASLNAGKINPSIIKLTSDRILITGGIGGSALLSPESQSASLILSPNAEKLIAVGNLNSERTNASIIQLNSGHIMIIGGLNSNGLLNSSEIFSESNNSWKILPNTLPVGIMDASVVLKNGVITLAGGIIDISESTHSSQVLIYEEANGLWKHWGDLSLPRAGIRSLVETEQASVFAFGGLKNGESAQNPKYIFEIF